MTEVERVQTIDLPYQRDTTGDLVEFGTSLHSLGLSSTEARGVVEELQAIVNTAVMNAVPRVMNRIQSVHRERMAILAARIRMQPSMAGFISRDTVLALIGTTMAEIPKV